jgi:hypothetical protein
MCWTRRLATCNLHAMPEDVTQRERERRQLSLMQQRIASFRSGELFIARLIADLKGLLEARECASEEWIDDFRSASGDLEISYAVALDRLTPIPDAHDPCIADDLFDLDALSVSALAELEQHAP